MSDVAAAGKWDRLSRIYDLMTSAEHLRLAPLKATLFERARGRVLFVGAGTGKDFDLLPRGLDVVAIDVSPRMVEKARVRAAGYDGRLEVRVMDAQRLEFPDASFDTVLTVCVLCSIPRPAVGLQEIRRILRPGGRVLLFEHVRSRIGPISIMQDIFTVLSRRFGPDMNRDTVGNVLKVGFRLIREENLYLDIVKAIEVEK